MKEFLLNTFLQIQQMPPDQIGNLVFYWLTPFLIFCVCVWGFLELWLDHRQGKFVDGLKWITMQVSVPKDAIQTPKGIENFFTALSGAKGGVSFKDKWFTGKVQAWFGFEIISRGGTIGYYIRTQEKYKDYIEAAFYAQYPEAQFQVVEDYADEIPSDYPNDEYDLWGSELVLKKDDHIPLRTWDTFEHQGEKDMRFKDPLLNVLEALGTMRPGENFYIQLIIGAPDDQDWTKAGQKYIDKLFGKPEPSKKPGFFEENIAWLPFGIVEQTVGMVLGGGGGEAKKQDDFKAFKITPFEKDLLDAVNRKIGKVGWNAKIRFVYWGKKELMRKGTVAPMAKGLFAQYGHQSLNSLMFVGTSTPQDDYPWQEWNIPKIQRALASRYKSRSLGSGGTPKIMNVEELATIWHFPAFDARTPVLTTVGAKRAEAPVELNFAPGGTPTLMNLDKSPEDGFGKRSQLPPRKPLAVPGIRATYQPTNTPNDAGMVAVPVEPTTQDAPVQDSVQMPAYRGPQGPSVAAYVSASQVAPEPMSEQFIERTLAPDEVPASQQPQQRAPQQSPVLPTMPAEDRAHMPRPGMPAPLPPGLDISDQPVPPDMFGK